MHCDKWNEAWVAHLYDELEAEERLEVEGHLSACSTCRARMQELSETRSLIGASAPTVPAMPRVVVLRSRSRGSSAWAFVAGVAAATLVFFVGVLAAPGTVLTGSGDPTTDAAVPAGLTATDLASLVQRMDQRLDDLEQASAGSRTSARDTVATRGMLEERFDSLQQQVNRKRFEDLDFVLQTLAATQYQTDTRMERTERTLDYLALREVPSIREK